MKKIIIRICGITGIIIGTLAALYIGLSVYYVNGFSYGTWINGVYCTGRGIGEINRELQEKSAGKRMEIVLPDGRTESLEYDRIGGRMDYGESLKALLDSQDSWRWYENLGKERREQNLPAVFTFDPEKFEKAYSEFAFVKEALPGENYRVFIEWDPEEGYVLWNEREKVFDPEKCKKAVYEAALRGEESLILTEKDCFSSLPLTEEMQETVRLFQEIDAFQDCGIVYQLGDERLPITKADVSLWMVKDENGYPARDEDGNFFIEPSYLDEFVDLLADVYDTVGSVRKFQATRGETVMISGGTYGNEIDRAAEKNYLREAFRKGDRGIREPAYLKKAWKQGREDIGDTYIEIDMGCQQMYYYENGEQILATPIVTGNMIRKRDTPSMVCFVYGKQRNRVLRGPGYASPVKYWMPIKGGIGIHDARWRDDFGGDIYKTNGSHGCINTPDEAMAELYERVQIGTPVVLFY